MQITHEEAIVMSAELAAENIVCLTPPNKHVNIEICRYFLEEEAEERPQTIQTLVNAWDSIFALQVFIGNLKPFQWSTRESAEKRLIGEKAELLTYINMFIALHLQFDHEGRKRIRDGQNGGKKSAT